VEKSERLKIIPERVSYSALVNFNNCGHYYENVNLKKLKPAITTPDMAFGTLIHTYTQAVLMADMSALSASIKFKTTWDRFNSFWKLNVKYKNYSAIGEKAVLNIENFLKESFGNFKVKHVEYNIENPIPGYPQYFKGFIDIVLQLENKKIVIIDLKTAASFYFFEQYRDKVKDYQISLYKKYYSGLEKISLDDISTYFVVFEKSISSKKPINVVEVGSSNKKLENAEEWLNNALRLINAGKFYKNLKNCRKYGDNNICSFYRTDNCQ